MMDHAAKINIGMGVLVLGCFFLPWVGLSCGDVTFIKLSGYQMTTGKISLDDAMLREYQSQLGVEQTEEGFSATAQQSQPKFYFLIVILCALNIIFFSVRMLDELDRAKSIIAMVFADVGMVFMIIMAVIDFGMDIPSGSEMIIHTTYQLGYYVTVVAFAAVAALSVLTIKAMGVQQGFDVSMNLKIPEQSFSGHDAVEHSSTMKAGEQGSKICKQCGRPAAQFQMKCYACGSTNFMK